MPVIITSNTDKPEDVAAAMGGEIEQPDAEAKAEGKSATADASAGKDGAANESKNEGKGAAKGSTEGTSETVEKDEQASGETSGEGSGKSGEGDETGEGEGSSEGEGTGEGQPPAKPRKLGGFQKKIARLEEENALLVDLIKKEGIAKKDTGTETSDDKPVNYSGKPEPIEPKIEDFVNHEDPQAAWVTAHGKWTVLYNKWSREEAVAQVRAERDAEKTETTKSSNESAFITALDEDRAKGGIYEDYNDVLESIAEENVPITELMNEVIMEAREEDGRSLAHAMMHWMAKHPDEAGKIASLPPKQQLARMGVIQAKAEAETIKRRAELESKAKKTTKNSNVNGAGTTNAGNNAGSNTQQQQSANQGGGAKPVKTTKAPPPINPTGKRSAPASTDLETVAASGDFRSYEAQRRAQGFKYR